MLIFKTPLAWLVITVIQASAVSFPTVEETLAAQRDLWGELALQQPNGPSYEFFEKALPPLRYVAADFRHYAIPLAAPREPQKGRLISNGSGINLHGDATGANWKRYACPVGFRVGATNETFGADVRRLEGPRYADGYLPIVRLGYRAGDATYSQEAFAGVDSPYKECGTIFAKLSQGVIAQLGATNAVLLSDGVVGDGQGRALAWFDANWRWDAAKKELCAGGDAVLAVFAKAMAPPPKEALTAKFYELQRQRCARVWNEIIEGGTRVEVPEPVVNNAWRAVICGSLICASGDRMNYSAGNGYEGMYEAECGDAARGLLLFGRQRDAAEFMPPLLELAQGGLGFHNAAFKLQLLAHYYWLMRDAECVRAQRARWKREADFIVQSREANTGLLPRENYCGDIHDQVYTLNSNANAWRGLRDLAAVLRDLGEPQEAERYEKAAADFRQAILAAIEKSERRDARPPFVPIALLGEEKPYETLTASRLGSYWCLMIPYVLGSGVLANTEREQWIADYLQQRGGLCMNLIRFHQHAGSPFNDNGLDDYYSQRYVEWLFQHDQVERALASFYGKLAQAMTRETFLSGEITGLTSLDEFGRPMFWPPNTTGNAFFLTMLRETLVQDWDLDGDCKPETLRLAFATPRRWLRDGAIIKVERAPSAFGEISFDLESRLNRGEIVARIGTLARFPKRFMLRARVPAEWRVVSAQMGDAKLLADENGSVEIPCAPTGGFQGGTIRFRVERKS
ncbi:MAG: hypothetical protein HY360_25800 [Verrucomicrobia bacterium]|nr:hypothetical protein [Verrucomicrobiota bacterium]